MGLRLLLSVLIICSLPQVGTAAPVQWQGSPYFIMTRGMPVTQLLHDFGANYGVPVVTSAQITDDFVGTFERDKPSRQLTELSRLYNLAWYYDGKVLYVYKAQEIASIALSPEPTVAGGLVSSLKKLGVLDSASCQILRVGSSGSFEVTGVPVCLKRIADLVNSMGEGVKAQSLSDEQREDVSVFPLTYASATDVTYKYRNQSVTVPGVVSVLRDMSGSDSLKLGKTVTAQQTEATGLSQENSPLFSADSRQNAVIIRDRAVNMPLYKKLISQLDKRQQAIEISVSIIDVDASDLNQLGVDWAANASIGSSQLQFNSHLMTGGNTFTSVVNNSGDFMVRVNALAEQSKAKVLSQPSVLTLNNVQAVLDKNVTFYTKLVGEKIAQLASVTSGTLMQVTPRIVDTAGGIQEVLLILNIQDGNQEASSSATETMPLVHNSEIDTQATLKPGQSLLLGGFVQDQTTVTNRKIPLLGDLPLIGGLFRSTENSKNKIVRLFLIKAVPLKLS